MYITYILKPPKNEWFKEACINKQAENGLQLRSSENGKTAAYD